VHRVDDRSAGLRTGVVDVAIRRGEVADPGVWVEPIFEEGRMAAVPVTSPLAELGSLTLEALSGEVVALSSLGTTTLDLWPAGARPTRSVEVTNTDEWLVAIASGEAVGVTAASTVSQHPHPGVRFVPLTGAPDLTVSLVWPVDGAHPAIPDFVEVVRGYTWA
jgi:DNA-binding transcriptional LysR family regulator